MRVLLSFFDHRPVIWLIFDITIPSTTGPYLLSEPLRSTQRRSCCLCWSDYSRKEIKEAAKAIDAGESSPLTEEILDRLPDHKEPIETPTEVTSEQIRELTPTMTREEVLSRLGDTQDIGSGLYIYVYEVDGAYLLRIPFAGDEAQLGVTGEDLLKALTPISGDQRNR